MTASVLCAQCGRSAESSLPGGLCEACRGTGSWSPASTATQVPATESPLTGQSPADTARADAGTRPEAGSRFPAERFEVLGSLGRGGMGAVWKVRERATGSLFALKTLQGRPDSGHGGRFRIEAQALTRLRHPNIVRVHEIDLEDESPYFTMELVEGGTLEERVRRDGPLLPVEAAQLVEVIARAADHAHRAGVLHRDIKPANVLLTPTGEVKVSDFGLAKRLDRADGRTSTLSALGTPGYMAPEQVSRTFGQMGPATDVYGLGATLYRLLTGRPTIDSAGKDTVIVMAECTTADVPDPRTHRSEIPVELATICRKCLQKNPADRYPDAASLADDLSLWLAGRQPKGRLPSWSRRASRAIGRHWRTAVGALAVLALVAGAVVMGTLWHPDEPPVSDGPTVPGPDEILAGLQQDLRAGKAIVLPDRGLPAWQHWVFGKVDLEESPFNDGTCSLQTGATSLVDLFVPDVDRYRVSVELRELRSVQPNQESNTESIGLTLGRQERTLANGTKVHTVVAIRFADHVGPRLAVLNKGKARVHVEAVTLIQTPGLEPVEFPKSTMGAGEFEPTSAISGEWRRIEAEVTPGSVRVRWQPKPDAVTAKPDELGHVDRNRLISRFSESIGKLPSEAVREFAAAPYDWDSRRPVGIYCKKSRVAIRNLVVELLPED